MKKYGILMAVVGVLLIITGCNDMMNTPTRRVEEYLGKYQSLDSNVLTDLDSVMDESNYSNNYKEKYKELFIKQYQNLSYKIKNEDTNGDNATVTVEIEVFDYNTSLEKSNDYIKEHQSEFKSDDKMTSLEKEDEYKIKELKNVTDKVSYTIVFRLVKDNKKWVLEKVSDNDIKKIHGLYKD